MLDVPGFEIENPHVQFGLAGNKPEIPTPTKHSYIKHEEFCDESWTEADLAELWDHAQKKMPRVREDAVYAGKVIGKKRIIGLGSYSISANTRGVRDGVVNPKAKDISQAPTVVQKLAARLTKLNNGAPINYLSFIAYENERDHINWHQHHEDRCRDAAVYIVSMGEVRTFGIRRVCENHRICEDCNESCHASGKTLCASCKKRVKARAKCKVCESTPEQWTTLQPEHGSVIVLPDEYNRTHEHAVLGKQDVGGDKTTKGLRISINTKNIREEDIAYVERENRNGIISLSADTLQKGIAPPIPGDALLKAVPEPKTEVVHCKRDKYDVYIGKINGTAGKKDFLPESPFANRSGGDYEAYLKEKLLTDPSHAAKLMDCHGKRLGCWCKGTSRDFAKCHGHIVAKWTDRIYEKWHELKPDKVAMRAWINTAASERG